MSTTAKTTTLNDSLVADVMSPSGYVEYSIANWLWLYVAPALLVIGVTGNTHTHFKLEHINCKIDDCISALLRLL